MTTEQNIMQYNEAAMERFKTLLETAAEKGTPKYYEIVVDNLKVIEKTNDVNEFDNYLSFITEHTKQVQILIYTNNLKSPRHTKYTFILNTVNESKGNELSGIEIQNRITQGIQAEREKWEKDAMKKEMEELNDVNEELTNYIKQLESTIVEMRQNKNTFKGIHLGEIAGVGLEMLLRNNVKLLEKHPLTKGLAGLIAQDNNDKKLEAGSPSENAEVSFSSADHATALSEADQNHLNYLKHLQEKFSEENYADLMEVIKIFGEEPNQVKTVKELLQNKI